MPRKSTIVLGISFGHGDSSAALVVDGCLVAAAEEERFTRTKHYALFPAHAIAACLRHARLNPKEVQAIAIARKPRNAFLQKALVTLRYPQLLGVKRQRTPMPSIGWLAKKMGMKSAKIVHVEHHLAHLMSARYLSKSEDLALLSIDGLGDFVSVAMARPKEHSVEILNRVYFPHSLGFFYTALTQFLGFPHYGDEYKVMGLSSYGVPRYIDAMRALIRETNRFGFELNLEAFPVAKTAQSLTIDKAQPKVHPFFNTSFLTQIVGLSPRKPIDHLTKAHWDLAKSVQMRFEEIANHLVHQVHAHAGGTTLAIAGGCAHNSVWVGKIPKSSPYRKIYVAPAANDAGLAAGAAIQVAGAEIQAEGGHWGLLGPSPEDFSPEIPAGIQMQTFSNERGLIAWMVDELCQHKIIGTVEGRMEFGPRALGSRSILADPREAFMRNRLNERVKHRESFRPFAASVLQEHQEEWFNNSFSAPFMEAVFEVRAEMRSRIPAVVHVDNSCRIQTVSQKTQPFFWNLLQEFFKKTGVPMLINTSFNDNEPIVCTESDAYRCFLTNDLDHLVVGLKVFTKAKRFSLTG